MGRLQNSQSSKQKSGVVLTFRIEHGLARFQFVFIFFRVNAMGLIYISSVVGRSIVEHHRVRSRLIFRRQKHEKDADT